PPTSFAHPHGNPRHLHSFPTRRSSDLILFPPLSSSALHHKPAATFGVHRVSGVQLAPAAFLRQAVHRHPSLPQETLDLPARVDRSEEHTSELQSRENLVCRLLLEKKNT